MSVWKRNAVVLAIVLFVGVAVYLNWSYNNQLTGEGSGTDGSDGKVLGQTTLVNGVDEEQDGETAEGQTEEETGSGYFASARLNRQQARDSALELLQEAAADEKADQKVVDEANASIQTMADDTLSEAQVENLVTAKGYGDCVCFIGEDGVNLVVSSTDQGLSETDIAKIVEIVREETGLSADQIKIIEAKP
ncbi:MULTISPECIES: SpoIIIAH-like family protein [Pseudoflavonifractor]|uniref:SpoIIIAH-like family protein n=1 Tax=Candidatus Enterenecus faecium TaxID=2840780 RepID=A0A9D1CG67_9FIRM|nr:MULTISPECIES: SpoIIIAH-like family protein [Pseudoflavonifractor]HIQ60726.1 SpoIIIAH-like family protein [Candidatus Enterenecus faecium]MBM6694004.1 SpoIIIAH-like family protein [Pseudoflavonifractor capillosus]NJE73419.1 SpoIIIAH-like family protein [Pseudoflavonifractor sp. SW1122]OUN99736.1 stage III sporulation protein AH [Pseudoflavonifractor sp. An44]OUP45235.1 stage III sporulation protein AH [Pseudoflavonifractor sp. An187]